MAIEVPDLVGKVRLDTSGLDQAVGQAAEKGSFLGSVFGTALGGVAAGAITAAGDALFGFATGAVSAAQESLKVSQTTEQIIKSTGGAAGLSAEQVGDLAGELSNLTGFDDEVVQGGQNLLLTFKNVKDSGTGLDAIFTRASTAALDLSAAGFGSVESASLQLGKALNDPVKGIAALSRSGVTFTEQQKEQIKTLQASGDALGAQKIILAEVEAQVGGVAAATADPFARFQVSVGNIQEALGGLLLPAASALADAFVDDVVPAIEVTLGTLGDLSSQAYAFLQPVGDGIRDLGALLFEGDYSGGLAKTFGLEEDSAVVSTLLGVHDAVDGVVQILFRGNYPSALSALGLEEDSAPVDFLFSIRDAVTGIIDSFQSGGGGPGAILTALGLDPEQIAAVEGVVLQVQDALGVAGASLAGLAGPAGEAGTAIVSTLLPALGELGGGVIAALLPVLGSLYELFYASIVPALVSVAEVVLGTVVPAVAGFVEKLVGALLPIIQTVAGFITGSVVPALQAIVGGLGRGVEAAAPFIEFVVRLAGLLVQLAGAILGPVVNALSTVLGPVLRVAGQLLGALFEVVGTVIGAVGRFGNALLDVAENPKRLTDAVSSAVQSVLGFFRNLPGQVLGALGALGGLLVQAGTDLIQGLLNGVGNMAGRLAGKVREVVNGGISAAKAALGIASPSKVFREIGEFVGEGLIDGLTGSAADVAKAADTLADQVRKGFQARADETTAQQKDETKRLTDGLRDRIEQVKARQEQELRALGEATGKRAAAVKARQQQIKDATSAEVKSLQAQIDAANDAAGKLSGINTAAAEASSNAFLASIQTMQANLTGLAVERDAIAKDLEAATKRLDDAIKLRDDYAGKVADQAAGIGSLVSILQGIPKDGVLDASTIITGLEGAKGKVDQFNSLLDDLYERGASDAVLRQIVDAGVEKGTQIALAILAGGTDAIDQVNALNDALAESAAELGRENAEYFFQAGVDSAQGLVDGLASQEEALRERAARIAAIVAEAMRNALQIKSPSRVTRAIGVQTGEGFALGLADQVGRAAGMAGKLAASATGALRSSVGGLQIGAAGGGVSVAAAPLSPTFVVRAYIGDTELRDLVRFEIDDDQAALAAATY